MFGQNHFKWSIKTLWKEENKILGRKWLEHCACFDNLEGQERKLQALTIYSAYFPNTLSFINSSASNEVTGLFPPPPTPDVTFCHWSTESLRKHAPAKRKTEPNQTLKSIHPSIKSVFGGQRRTVRRYFVKSDISLIQCLIFALRRIFIKYHSQTFYDPKVIFFFSLLEPKK